MKKIITLFVVMSLIISCDNSTHKNELDTNTKNTEQEPTKPEQTEVWEPKPATVRIAKNNAAPSDAIILFDGSNLDEWVSTKDSTAAKWLINKDGSMTIKQGSGDIQTKKQFGSVQLHIEWKSPSKIKNNGQHRGNSGIFLQKRYEIQILDNNDNETYSNGQVGSIYKQSIPLVKALVPTGEWNTYDIIFHRPEFDTQSTKTKSATITVLHNGILIQDHFELLGTTEYIGWPKNLPHGDASIVLQDHDSEVSYRNIWLRKL